VAFPVTDSGIAISGKYWSHLREKINLGPLAYLKFPPFHGPVKTSKVGTHLKKPLFPPNPVSIWFSYLDIS
jgi:hypothetical protein